jgi:peptidoglycan/LPS O-acetylase OafA/YrhL
MSDHWSLKRSLLHCLIAALVLSAAFGIYVFLFGSFGATETRIILTTLAVAYYSLMSLACAVAWEKRRTRVLSLPGLVVCAVGFAFLLVCIWSIPHESERVAKATAILAVFSFSFAQASVLSLARLKPKLRWVSWIAVVSIFSLAILVSTMIVVSFHDDWWLRAVGVLGIIDACASLSIPVLYKLGRLSPPAAARQPYQRIELVCPRCGHRGDYPLGRIQCAECALRMRVEVSEKPDVEEDPPFQFSIRSLLLITLIAALGLGILGSRLKQSHRPPRPASESPAR